MNLIENERTKLLAAALNTACTSCFTVGIATPAAGYIFNVSNFRANVGLATLMVAAVGWLITAAGLHLLARHVLGRLRP